ncbi:MAG: CYTH domain-containing protein [Lachnospiraceae bacterium]
MEIERKFLIKQLPDNLEQYENHLIEQAYLSINPVIRVRKEDTTYYMIYKGQGMMIREEYNLPLTKQSYEHLLAKADGRIITKRRYKIPLTQPISIDPTVTFSTPLTIELDIFEGDYEGLWLAEIEFATAKEAEALQMPDWFLQDVTFDGRYHNSYMALR